MHYLGTFVSVIACLAVFGFCLYAQWSLAQAILTYLARRPTTVEWIVWNVFGGCFGWFVIAPLVLKTWFFTAFLR